MHNKTHFSVYLITMLLGMLPTMTHASKNQTTESCPSILNHTVKKLASDEQVNLCQAYLGKVILIVNTASKCAFTGQYEGLEKLYADYKERGVVILGFPSNDFGQQEPGTEQQVQSFCRLTYGVQFPMFAKTQVKKSNADPLFRGLGEATGVYPKWNFYKYLLDQQGNIVDTYSSISTPKRIRKDIDKLLNH